MLPNSNLNIMRSKAAAYEKGDFTDYSSSNRSTSARRSKSGTSLKDSITAASSTSANLLRRAFASREATLKSHKEIVARYIKDKQIQKRVVNGLKSHNLVVVSVALNNDSKPQYNKKGEVEFKGLGMRGKEILFYKTKDGKIHAQSLQVFWYQYGKKQPGQKLDSESPSGDESNIRLTRYIGKSKLFKLNIHSKETGRKIHAASHGSWSEGCIGILEKNEWMMDDMLKRVDGGEKLYMQQITIDSRNEADRNARDIEYKHTVRQNVLR